MVQLLASPARDRHIGSRTARFLGSNARARVFIGGRLSGCLAESGPYVPGNRLIGETRESLDGAAHGRRKKRICGFFNDRFDDDDDGDGDRGHSSPAIAGQRVLRPNKTGRSTSVRSAFPPGKLDIDRLLPTRQPLQWYPCSTTLVPIPGLFARRGTLPLNLLEWSA